jgi:hypothetical protein
MKGFSRVCEIGYYGWAVRNSNRVVSKSGSLPRIAANFDADRGELFFFRGPVSFPPALFVRGWGAPKPLRLGNRDNSGATAPPLARTGDNRSAF